MRKKALLIIFIGVLYLCFSACQQTEKLEENKYEIFLSEAYKKGKLNGNILIVEKGNVVYQKSFGIGNILRNEGLHLDSQFRLASISKQFTAMAIVKLKNEGKLNYDQKIQDFYPELPYDNITIRHLLHHVSGVADYEKLMGENWRTDLKNDEIEKMISGNQDIIDMFIDKKPPMSFQPGDKWEYSNTGYVLLASIVEIASGKSFAAYLKEKIFDPLQMTNSLLYTYTHNFDPTTPNRVFGFKIPIGGKDSIANDYHYVNPVKGDGGIFSTVGDLYKWDRGLYNTDFISTEDLNEIFTSAILNNGEKTNYGFGWGLGTTATGTRIVDHSGGWVGFRTYFHREIDDNNSVIVLTNNTSNYVHDIKETLIKILHNEPYKFPKISIRTEMGKTIVNDGLEKGLQLYQKAKIDTSQVYSISEYQLNGLAYDLKVNNHLKASLAIYRLSIKDFPNSAYTYDKFGDALLQKGDTANALESFKKAYSLDSNYTNSLEKATMLKD